VAALLFVTASAGADTIVFVNGLDAGDQENFALGMDFTVNAAVTVTQLGAFDSGQNGIVNTITVGIFNVATGLQVGPSAIVTTGGTLIGGSRFVDVPDFLLPVGLYSIVAAGFTGGNTFSGNTGFTATTFFDSFGGLLTLVPKGGRWTDPGDNTYALPTAHTGVTDFYGQPDPVFEAGTFMVAAVSVPDAGLTSMMLGLGVLTLGWIRRRIK
jgi:hypothetical protein